MGNILLTSSLSQATMSPYDIWLQIQYLGSLGSTPHSWSVLVPKDWLLLSWLPRMSKNPGEFEIISCWFLGVLSFCFLGVSKVVPAMAAWAAPASSLPTENSLDCNPRLMASYEAFKLEDRRPLNCWVAAIACEAAAAIAPPAPEKIAHWHKIQKMHLEQATCDVWNVINLTHD